MLERLGRWSYRARWMVVLAWVLLFLMAATFAPRVGSVLKGGGYNINSSQSIAAYNVLHRAYAYNSLTFTAVFAGGGSRARIAAARRFRGEVERRYGAVFTVAPPVWTPDRKVVFERIYSPPLSDFGASYAGKLRALLPLSATRAYLTGNSAIFHDMEVVSDQDLRGIEIVTLPLAALVLLLIFGSVLAAFTPVLMAPVAVTLALALIYWLGHRLDMSIFVLNTASMLGLGVAIDYSLFMVNRFREELAAGHDIESAVGQTVATSGRAILVSALVVSLGFFALALTNVSMMQSIGLGGGIVTLLSLVVALTFLPAILGILGHRINLWPVLPRSMRGRGLWRSIAYHVMRRPWPVIALVMVIVGVLAIPALRLRVGIPGPEILPPSVDSRAGNDILDRHLGLANQSPVLMVVQRLPGTPTSTERQTAFEVLDRVCSSGDVAGIGAVPVADSPGQLHSCASTLAALQHPSSSSRVRAARQRVALISVFLHSSPSSAASEAYVHMLRRDPPIPGYRLLVGGQTAGQIDFDQYIYARFPLVVLFVIGAIYLILLLAFRSVLLPLKAILMNIFSIGAAYGVLVWAFQDGHLASPLGFTQIGNIDSIVPIFLFSVLFGISTDYEVFLLTRVYEEYLRTGRNEESVAHGLEFTGRIITSAAAVMIVVFAAFAFARLLVIKELGLGLAVAVLVDATLIRAMLVPATMRILGRWNWWLPVRGFPRVSRDVSSLPDQVAD